MDTSDVADRHFSVDIVLADMVRVSEGKLDALGIGWQTHMLGATIGVGVVIQVPWTETNRKHRFELVLEDADGQPVMIPQPTGGFSPFQISGDLEVGRPPGQPIGTPFATVLPAINLNGLPLQPGRRYTFIAHINHQTAPEWQKSFGVQAPPAQKLAS